MYTATHSSHFAHDVKACKKKHWDMDVFKESIEAILRSDSEPIELRFDPHSLTGVLKGKRAVHVPTKDDPPSGTWVIVYEVIDDEAMFYRTGTHDVYGQVKGKH